MQGFNMGRYHPPDAEGINPNTLHNKRAPGTLRKDGTQTVRFELPYSVWCTTCKPDALLAQGLRFNAIKKKIGNYHSTPIFSFTIKHTACSGHIEIHTDPKNTAYVVISGGRARDYGEQREEVRVGEGGVPILSAEERDRRREDAFSALEGKKADAEATRTAGKRLQELYHAGKRDWEDTYDANRRMRTAFREKRKVLEKEAEATEKLKERLGTDMDLLPETEEDTRRARLVVFERDALRTRKEPVPFIRKTASSSRITKPTKENSKDALRRQLLGNTRAALNPF